MSTGFFTLQASSDGRIFVLDQRQLPFCEQTIEVKTAVDMAFMISDMAIRGAGLIGVGAAYGAYLAAKEALASGGDFHQQTMAMFETISLTRPTAVNLAYALKRQSAVLARFSEPAVVVEKMWQEAEAIRAEDIAACARIGEIGAELIAECYLKNPQQPVNILTHCNAGKLAFIEHGTALAPIYEAQRRGIPVHVWVEETRPRNQGAALTVWELGKSQIPFSLITDNAGGHVLQKGLVDIAFVGCDRASRNGDICNKIGTYKTALACHDNQVPFYGAFPSSTFDFSLVDALRDIPIEERSPHEVSHMRGMYQGQLVEVEVAPADVSIKNYGFDVTPARLVSGIITERGLCTASRDAIEQLYPEK